MFVFIDTYQICKTRDSKMVKNKDMQFFYGEFENEQKKELEFEPQIFSKFPAHDLNFHGRW